MSKSLSDHCFFAGALASASNPGGASLSGEAEKEMPDRFDLPSSSFPSGLTTERSPRVHESFRGRGSCSGEGHSVIGAYPALVL